MILMVGLEKLGSSRSRSKSLTLRGTRGRRLGLCVRSKVIGCPLRCVLTSGRLKRLSKSATTCFKSRLYSKGYFVSRLRIPAGCPDFLKTAFSPANNCSIRPKLY